MKITVVSYVESAAIYADDELDWVGETAYVPEGMVDIINGLSDAGDIELEYRDLYDLYWRSGEFKNVLDFMHEYGWPENLRYFDDIDTVVKAKKLEDALDRLNRLLEEIQQLIE